MQKMKTLVNNNLGEANRIRCAEWEGCLLHDITGGSQGRK